MNDETYDPDEILRDQDDDPNDEELDFPEDYLDPDFD